MNGEDSLVRLTKEESCGLFELANKVVLEASGHVDRFCSGRTGWTECGCEGDVQLFSMNVGESLPMFLGQLRTPGNVADLTAVLLSDACRQFWDPSYLTSHLLCSCEGTSAVLCLEQKASPVSAEALWTNVCTARYTRREQDERMTYIATSVPSTFRSQYHRALSTWGEKKELITKMWAMDVLRPVDAAEQVTLSFLLQTEASCFRLPNFMLKQVLASYWQFALNPLREWLVLA